MTLKKMKYKIFRLKEFPLLLRENSLRRIVISKLTRVNCNCHNEHNIFHGTCIVVLRTTSEP